jgi:integrase
MASLIEDPSGNWHVHFRFGGKRFKRSLQTKKESEAKALCGRIEDNIQLVRRGIKSVPTGGDVFLFLLSDGKVDKPVELPDQLTLGELVIEYERSIAASLEESTCYTVAVHTRHLKRLLGESLDARSITLQRLDDYVRTRQGEKTQRGTNVTSATVRKEITTLKAIWSWAEGRYELGGFPSVKKLAYAKAEEKPPFQTWAEIERQISRGGLSDKELQELWDSLFLSLDEVAELLKYVRKEATQPFVYPMFVMAAHTGARRSEMLRSQIGDIADGEVVIRERKRVRGKRSTRRVPMSRLMKTVMRGWLKTHPGGQYTFCQDKRGRAEPITRDQAHDHFKRTLADSKWSVLRGWHVLRHSFISNCALKGIDQRIIDSFVGHTTEEMRRRYTHLFPSAKKDAIKSVFG